MYRELKNAFLKTTIYPFHFDTTVSENTLDLGNEDLVITNGASSGQKILTFSQLPNRGATLVTGPGQNVGGGGQSYDSSTSGAHDLTSLKVQTIDSSGSSDPGQAQGFVVCNNSDDTAARRKNWSIVKSVYGGMRIIPIQINTTTPTVTIGGNYVTVVKNSTGNVTVTPKRAFVDVGTYQFVAVATSIGADTSVRCNTATADAFGFIRTDGGTTATDGLFNAFICGFDLSARPGGRRRPIGVPFLKPRMIYGHVGSDHSTIHHGSGAFTVSTGGTGICDITFTDAFASEPVVIADTRGTIANIEASSSSASGVSVQSYSGAGALSSRDFNFIAIGDDYGTEHYNAS